MGLKNVMILLLALTCLMAYAAAARNNIDVNMINDNQPGYNLAARLEANGGQVVECWKTFVEFQLSCSNATVQYFLNRHVDISHCCHAIDVITHKCSWPTNLTSLGFTRKESSILISYCAASPAPSPAA